MSWKTKNIGPKKGGEPQIRHAITRRNEPEVNNLRQRPKGTAGEVDGEEFSTQERVRTEKIVFPLKRGDGDEKERGDGAGSEKLVQRHFFH